MDEPLPPRTSAAHVELHLREIGFLIARGRHISERDFGAWLRDCAAAVNQLSGGTKTHWLARAYSDAFLDRSKIGADAMSLAPVEIAARVIAVLERGAASLSQMDPKTVSRSTDPQIGRLFGFVRNEGLRPVLEEAFVESRVAFDSGDYRRSLLNACSIMEAIVTDALEQHGMAATALSGWSFEARLSAAETAGIIGKGCARLPAAARRYREDDGPHVTERDARVAGQVLRVLMRDLDPGR